MHTQYDIKLSGSRGISNGEQEEILNHTAGTLRVELHSSYLQLLDSGLERLTALHPLQLTLVIELTTDKGCVIFAKELSLLEDFTYAVTDVATGINLTNTPEYSHLHWNLRVKYGN